MPPEVRRPTPRRPTTRRTPRARPAPEARTPPPTPPPPEAAAGRPPSGPARSGAWRPPRSWRAAQVAAWLLVASLVRLRVTGDVPAAGPGARARGPLILAANHISPFDPIALTAACRTRRIAPRFLAMGELFRAPLRGALLRRWGHLPVHRRTAQSPRRWPMRPKRSPPARCWWSTRRGGSGWTRGCG